MPKPPTDIVVVSRRSTHPMDIENGCAGQFGNVEQDSVTVFGLQGDSQDRVAQAPQQFVRDARRSDLTDLAADADHFRQAVWISMNLAVWEIVPVGPATPRQKGLPPAADFRRTWNTRPAPCAPKPADPAGR